MTIRMSTIGGAIALMLCMVPEARGQAVHTSPAHARQETATMPALSESSQGRELGAADNSGSPYRLSWSRDGLVLGIAAAGSLVAAQVTSDHAALSVAELAEMTRDAVPWFDRSATYRYSTDLIQRSEQIGTPLVFAPLALLVDSRIRADWRPLAVMYVQTSLLAGATSTIAKETISRYRPYIYNTDLSYEERTEREPGKAFFSSAATSAFAQAVLLATVFSDHHPDSALKPYVWGASLGAAGAVGYLRYASGIHYPSDVVVGALVGAAIGYGVPRIHQMPPWGASVGLNAADDAIGLTLRFDF